VDVLNYEELVADFQTKLVTQLRNFGSEAEYLEMWVPDDDPVKSILNMVEAAEAYGRDTIAISVKATTLPAERTDSLRAKIGDLGDVEFRTEGEKMLITVTEIGSRS
jgi:hypothetical protein